MILDQETISYIIGITVLANVGLTVYNSLRKPQEKGEVTDAVFCERMNNYEKTTEKSVQLALNHSHTVESKIDSHIKESQAKGEADARWQGRIEALLDDRLPRK
jgi:Fe2+ or Zn2+ uptake regulation protein